MVQLAVPRVGNWRLAELRAEGVYDVIAPSRNNYDTVPHESRDQDQNPEEDAEPLRDASTSDTFNRTGIRDAHRSYASRDMAAVRAGLLVELFQLRGLRKKSRVIDGGAACLANLAQDEKHILLAGQRSQQRAFRQRLQFLRGDAQAVDQFAVISNLVEDRAFLLRCEVQWILNISFHGCRF